MCEQHHRLNEQEYERPSGDSEGRGAWHAAVPGSSRVRHDLATEQQQFSASSFSKDK